MIGMAVATVGIVIYFLAISSPRRPRHDASMVPARPRRWRRRFVSMTKTERRA
jgi:hypothetical protein